MTDLRRKNEFIMTKCKCQMLSLIFNSANLPENFKLLGVFCFLIILNYTQIIFSITVTSIFMGLK